MKKNRPNTVRTRMANTGYSEKDIDDRTAWVRSVTSEPADYSRRYK